MVSLKSSSSVEFEIKKIFLNFVFSRSYRGLKFCVIFCSLLGFVQYSVIFVQFSIEILFDITFHATKRLVLVSWGSLL